MAAKKKSRARSKPKSKSSPPWVWLFAGVVTGLFLAFLYHLTSVQTAATKPRVADKPKPARTAPPPRSESRPPAKYDFYNVLPEKDVADATKPRPKADAKTPDKPETVLIQTGSFRSAQEADRRRAELILLGLDVKVAQVKKGRETLHRVQIGPFDSAAKLASAKATLNENKVEYVVTRLK